MTEFQKRDVSISMAKANLYGTLIAVPTVILQAVAFIRWYGIQGTEPALRIPLLLFLILAGIPAHEFLHGLSWAIFGNKPFSAIKFGFMWKTLTPYAHVRESLDIGAYRLGAFMPGLVLGILPFIIAMLTGNGDLFWFSLLHTSAASGDWLVLWLLRSIKPGSLVEDHPTKAGCYVLEST